MQQNQEDLHYQIEQLQKHIEELKSSHLKENCSYNQRIDELFNKMQESENARSSLVQELQNAQSVTSSLEADNYSLRQELDEAKHQLSTSELERMKLQNRLEVVARQQRKMAHCFEKVKETIELTIFQHVDQLQILQKLKKEMESLDSQIAHSLGRSEAEEQQNAELVENANQSNVDTSKINSLPDEVILEIFGYLKQNQLGEISRVCRRWNVLTRRSELWKKVKVQFSNGKIEIFPPHRSPTAITKSFINRLPSSVTSIRLDFASSHENLDFVEFCEKLQEICPHIGELIITRCTFSCNFSAVIDLCTHFLQDLKKLAFYRCTFLDCILVHDSCTAGKYSGISNIESLDVFKCKFDYYGLLYKSSFSKMPYLRQLQLCVSDIGNPWFEGDTSFLNQLDVLNLKNAFKFPICISEIQNHGLNLKELCLHGDIVFNFKFTYSAFPQLVTICLIHCWNVTSNDIVSLLQSCQSLQNVYIGKKLAKSFAVHPYVVANGYKSKIVKETACNHIERIQQLYRTPSYF